MVLKNLIPIIFFIIGFILKKENLGKTLLKFNFYFLLPILIFKIFSTIKFNPQIYYMPLSSFVIIIFIYFFSNFYFKNIKNNKDKGVLIIAPMIMNISAVYPIIFLNFPDKYIQNVALFDLSNGILTLTFTYSIAIKFGSENKKIKFKKLLSPPLLALFIGLIFNYKNINLEILSIIFTYVKYAITFTIYFSLGSLFYFEKNFLKKILQVNFIRFFAGILIAIIIGLVINLDKTSLKILFLCATAPCGFNTLTFAVLENLNVKLASSIISISLINYFLIAFIILLF